MPILTFSLFFTSFIVYLLLDCKSS